jgi:hypothetical protein
MWMSEGRARPKGLHLVAALIAQESEDALIDTEARQPVVAQAARARLARVPERPRQERRRHQRITVGLSTEVSVRLGAGGRVLPGALTTDLTSNGACLCLSAEEDLLGSELELRWVSPSVAQRGSSAVHAVCRLLRGGRSGMDKTGRGRRSFRLSAGWGADGVGGGALSPGCKRG